jgi:hypothetical protein
MMSGLLHRTLKVGPIVGRLAASAAGCFVFTRGFELIAKEGEESDMGSASRFVGRVQSHGRAGYSTRPDSIQHQ